MSPAYQKINSNMHHFGKIIRQPRVFIFLLLGVLVFFFTFLTHDNAIEIVISGVASVFIGIGVNNYSSFETHIKDEQQMQSKLRNALDMMDLIQMQSHRIKEETNNGQMVELNKMIAICKRMLEEDY